MSAQIVGLVAHPEKPGAGEALAEMLVEFGHRGIRPELDRATAALVGEQSGMSVMELGRACEILVVLGGDGTILRVVHDLGECDKPLFGVNVGSLGFLTSLNWSDRKRAVACVAERSYVVTQRTMLSVELRRGDEVVFRDAGLNDAVISRGSQARLVHVEARINGEFFNEFTADGLIVATPTGSTAYSLSAGGPIISPDSGVLVVTPICPHVLSNRSIVVPDSSVIELRLHAPESVLFMSVDGRTRADGKPGDVVEIRRARRRVSLAMLPELTFSEVLRHKLKWIGSNL